MSPSATRFGFFFCECLFECSDVLCSFLIDPDLKNVGNVMVSVDLRFFKKPKKQVEFLTDLNLLYCFVLYNWTLVVVFPCLAYLPSFCWSRTGYFR